MGVRRPFRSYWPIWAAVSLLLHGAAVWLLLPHGFGARGGGTPPEIEVEMIQQTASTRGATAHTASQPPPQPTPPLPVSRSGAEVPPPVPPPAPPRTAPPGPAEPSEVNLGGGDADRDPLEVTGRNVVPPRPDALVHNEPPHYPPAAARRGAEGLVVLVVHVTANGVPTSVDVSQSSGDADLDAAARDAVALWRFRPARRGGRPVAFDYEMSIRFTLDGR